MAEKLDALNVWGHVDSIGGDGHLLDKFNEVRKQTNINNLTEISTFMAGLPNNLKDLSDEGYKMTDVSLLTGYLTRELADPQNAEDIAPQLDNIVKANQVVKDITDDFDRVIGKDVIKTHNDIKETAKNAHGSEKGTHENIYDALRDSGLIENNSNISWYRTLDVVSVMVDDQEKLNQVVTSLEKEHMQSNEVPVTLDMGDLDNGVSITK